jgi:hypothetical protein
MKKIREKLEESDGKDDNVYILHVKRYIIKTYSALGWWCVHVAYQENCI